MRRFFGAALVAAAIMAVIAAQASAAPDEDFVIGTGTMAAGTFLFDISIDAHSDASGGNPNGTVSVVEKASGIVVTSGPVTCLEVTGNTARLGIQGSGLGHFTLQVVDNAATGSPDTIAADTSSPSGTGCGGGGAESPLVAGDYVVHDAVPLTSKDQCKDSGWRDFTDDEGHPFENQGQCVAFLESHAT
jgi:hypothetical protein